MKKTVFLFLAVALCLFLGACGRGNDTPETTTQTPDIEAGSEHNSNEQETSFLIYDEDGVPMLNLAKFETDVETVELTTENWKDYIKVYSYCHLEETAEEDAFGERTSTETITHSGWQLGAGNQRYHCFEDVVIELKHKETGEFTVYEFRHDGYSVAGDFNPDDYECTRIKGYLYYLNFPEGTLPVSELLIVGWISEDGTVVAQPGYVMLDPGTNAVFVGGSMAEVLSWLE